MVKAVMVIFLVFVVLIIYLLYKSAQRRSDGPPGPAGLPIIGNLLSFDPNNPSDSLHKWAKQYGDIFSVKFGEQEMVFLTNPKWIKEALSSVDFIDRPEIFNFRVFTKFKDAGIVASNGIVWKENRRFSLRHLRDYGLGKSSIEDIVKREILEQISKIKQNVGQPIHLDWDFNIGITNIIWSITAGKRYAPESREIQDFLRMIQELIVFQGKAVMLDFFSWLQYPPFANWFGASEITSLCKVILEFFDNVIEERKKLLKNDEEAENLTDAYLKKFLEEEAKNPNFNRKEAEFDLNCVIADLFVAGGETTYTTLRWAFIFLTKYPKIQKKVQEEIDSLIGKDRLPTLNDKDSLVYCEAFILETQRLANIVPQGVPRAAARDVMFHGYRIPKGAQVLASTYSCHHDPKYWGDPEAFRPERFINQNGEIVRNEAFLPFGAGRRVCLGEALAKTELFLFVTCLLQRFTFRYDGDPDDISTEPADEGFVRYPKKYKMIAELR